MEIRTISGANRFAQAIRRREACRGIVMEDGNILMSYETNTDQWFLPGGGVEKGETLSACCRRELEEETGVIVTVQEHFLTIYEYYEEWEFISHYFLCKAEGTGVRALTAREIEAGLEPRWIPFSEAKAIFSHHPEYARTNEMKHGAYQREEMALGVYERMQGDA